MDYSRSCDFYASLESNLVTGNPPRPILLLLLKKTQEYIDKQDNLNHEPIEMNDTEFEDDKKIGQYALNVYGASWAWMGDPKDAALKMGLSPGLSSFSFLSFFCFLSVSFLFTFCFLPVYFLFHLNVYGAFWAWMGDPTQCPRANLNKKFLPRAKTTTA